MRLAHGYFILLQTCKVRHIVTFMPFLFRNVSFLLVWTQWSFGFSDLAPSIALHITVKAFKKHTTLMLADLMLNLASIKIITKSTNRDTVEDGTEPSSANHVFDAAKALGNM